MPADGTCELHILQVKDGSLIARIHSPDINVFTDPKFITNDSLVTAVRLQNGEMTLAVGSIENGSLVRLLPPSFNVMGYPCVYHHLIFFTASFGGNDDVFVLKMDDQKIYRVTHGPLGNYYVNAAGGKITWSAFTAEGFQLKQIAENPADWEEIKPGTEEKLTERFSVSHEGETGDILNGTIPLRQFPTGKYAKGTGLINLHSWRPYFEDPIFTFSLYGENVLNTLQSQLYYLYNRDDKTSAVGFSTTYGAAFPYISAGTEYTFDRRTGNGPQDHHWNQLDSRIGFIIPINFASGRTFKSFSFSNYYVLRNVFNKGYYKDSIGNTSFSYLLHSLSYTEQLPTALQHIYPRFAYSLSSSYRYPISLYSGYQFYASAALYLPGLLSNHNLILSSAFQQRDTSRLLFSSRMANARGYEDYYGTDAGSRLWRWSANYHLPLFHPDWGFGNMLYIQRLRANIFYDMQRIFSNDKSLHLDFHSTGVEFFADTKWWNQYPLTFGFRISHLLDDDPLAGAAKGSNFYEFILPVSIFPK